MRSGAEDAWDVARLAQEIRGSELLVRKNLAALVAAGLVIEEDGGLHRYRPASEDLARLVEDLAECYRTRPFAVRQAILNDREQALRSFSDAFKLKRDR
jgi:hypothetical protein